VSHETSLELILANSIGVEVGVAVGLPLVCCSSKQLVCCKENLLSVGALTYLSFFLTNFSQSSASMGSLACEKVLLLGLLVRLQMLESLQHYLHQLALVGDELLEL
jgi:hypothetical protein